MSFPQKGEGMSRKETKHVKGDLLGGFLLFGVLAAVFVGPWLKANRGRVVQVVAVAVVVGCVAAVVWWVRRWLVSGRGDVGGGWHPEGREVIAVVPVQDGGRRRAGAGPGLGRGKGDPVMDFWPWLLHTAGDLNTASRRVVRVLWAAHEGNGLVWGVSVDRDLRRSVERAVGSVWPEHKIEPWPPDASVEVSDSLPVEEGGGSVVRRLLAPRVLSRPLRTALRSPDHPMATIGDIIADHPAVNVQMKIDVVPLSASEREKVCRERLRSCRVSLPCASGWGLVG